MKACIYQKQTLVDIPANRNQYSFRHFKPVFTGRNHCCRDGTADLRRSYPLAYNQERPGRGMGPAGYARPPFVKRRLRRRWYRRPDQPLSNGMAKRRPAADQGHQRHYRARSIGAPFWALREVHGICRWDKNFLDINYVPADAEEILAVTACDSAARSRSTTRGPVAPTMWLSGPAASRPSPMKQPDLRRGKRPIF